MPDQRAIILSAAQECVRKQIPYLLGGNSDSGIDCSHLVERCYRAAGIDLEAPTYNQIKQCRIIDASEAQPADLIFFDIGNDTNGHVGIYVGDGQMIDAPSEGKTVRQEAIWQSYPHRYARHPGLDVEPAQAPTGPLLQAGTLAHVNADEGLRLRSQPSISSLLLTTLADQTAVFVGPIQQVADGHTWRQVATVGDANTLLVGYVAEEYLAA